MHAVLLTWNPGPDNTHVWSPEAWEAAIVRPTQHGQAVATTWGVGNHVHHIGPGDEAYLYRQGSWGRGIVARGVIRSRPWAAPHWDEAKARQGVVTHCVDVEWQDAVPVEAAIGVHQLEALVPEFGWRKVYSSGRRTPAGVTAGLRQVWEMHGATVADED